VQEQPLPERVLRVLQGRLLPLSARLHYSIVRLAAKDNRTQHGDCRRGCRVARLAGVFVAETRTQRPSSNSVAHRWDMHSFP